jgi:hypothetical protein
MPEERWEALLHHLTDCLRLGIGINYLINSIIFFILELIRKRKEKFNSYQRYCYNIVE